MQLKVSVEELRDKGVLGEFCKSRQWDTEVFLQTHHGEDEIYINESEAERFGFMGRSRDLFGGTYE